MPSLKKIRSRIASISSTRKITSAMKMVSAAKLKRAQQTIGNYLPYMEQLTTMAGSFINLEDDALRPVTEMRPLQHVVVVAIASNGSLCGGFNSNIMRRLQEMLNEYATVSRCNVTVYAIGKKVADWAAKHNVYCETLDNELTEKPSYQGVSVIANRLLDDFCEKKIDRVEIVYNHFKNAAVQKVHRKTLLPLAAIEGKKLSIDYIVEPSKAELINDLIPKVVRLQLYGALLDSVASEHGARTTAMQIATENADQLVQDLNLQYNKMRQGAITKEILDIIGGAGA